MNIDPDRIALLIGRLVLQAESNAQRIEELTRQLAAAQASEPKPAD